MESVDLVRRYYDALDEHEYEALESILAPAFTQRRPDRLFESRTAFVRFMRDERPTPETAHELESVIADDDRVAARGRVFDGDRLLFEFADFFDLEGDRIRRLETYSR